MTDEQQQTPALKHRPYVNARGEYINNGTNRELMCGWEHRDTCPLCQAILKGEVHA